MFLNLELPKMIHPPLITDLGELNGLSPACEGKKQKKRTPRKLALRRRKQYKVAKRKSRG